MSLEAILSKLNEISLKQEKLEVTVNEFQTDTRNQVETLKKLVVASSAAIASASSPMVVSTTTAGNIPTSPVFKVFHAAASVGDIETGAEVELLLPASAISAESPKRTAVANVSSTTSSPSSKSAAGAKKPLYAARIVLTTYPGSASVNPLPLHWGATDPKTRGPIVASRHPQSLSLRNAIGAYGGAYSIYRSLAIAMGELDPQHKPNLVNTEPVVSIGPHPSWFDPMKIVSMDPWGHLVQEVYASQLKEGLDLRPTIAITKAHMQLAEIEAMVAEGQIKVDGKVVLDKKGQMLVTKGAVEPVWFLPGIAKRFGVDEITLRRALFEDTGGMYPELITRGDLNVFLPPIGGLSIYIFGNASYLSDPTKKLTVRVHDECNGSDVFGSDICTCRPYLIYGIAECVRQAQEGGVGLIVYFRKEGRALGEVTKYLVYNARKRAEGGDTAKDYFLRTENIAGVKDMRFQATMPDVLHWLGIQKIDRMISMSNMKYDAIVGSGIKIIERVEIPAGMLPPDSQVEIDAKIASGYFTASTVVPPNLENVKGRLWEDVLH